ncbi:MAG TPA: ABC transporter transmembrane domain-containing protein [Bacteroidales bacterium]|nr:ABC transporter transmembrane domain-containing protein [Bacteroidales bacterium]
MNNIKRINKVSVLQCDSSDCGVACLASAIRYYGGDSSIEKLRSLSGTGITGTSMLGLYQAANKSGLSATGYEAGISDIRDHDNLLILHVLIGDKLEHYVLFYGYNEGKYTIWDPGRGLILMSEEDLTSIWKSGKCLSLSPNGDFIKIKVRRREKWQWILSMLRPDKDLLFVSAILGIVVSALGMVMALYTQKLIDIILPSGELRMLYISSGLVLLLLLVRIVITSVRQFFLLIQGKVFNVRVVDDFYTSLLDLPKWFFDSRKTGDFVARLNDTMRIQRVISDIVSIYIIDVLIIIITTGILFYFSFTVGIISIISLPIIYFILFAWNTRIISAQHDLMSGYAMNESNFIDSIKGILAIKSLTWKDYYSVRNKSIYSEFQDKIVNLGKIKIKLNLIAGFAGSVFLITILVWTSGQVMKSSMTQGELMAILSLGSSLLPAILNLALISVPVSEVKVAIDRMFEFTLMESEFNQDEDNSDSIEINSLELKDISFRYPGQRIILDKINMIIRKGQLVSLVGESGCGKSTLASILMKFYPPESGDILCNGGNSYKNHSLVNWRSRIAIIPQEIHIFNGTILQNLIAEINESKIDELITSISKYGLTSFYDSFPSGLMTIVGEEGINLSGGQKQSLAFTRALLQKPDILIIDEGTSNMDRAAEAFILGLISRLKSEMGILMISHRINMIKKLSDFIYVMEGNTINAKGTHLELIGGNNLYSRFWKDFE